MADTAVGEHAAAASESGITPIGEQRQHHELDKAIVKVHDIPPDLEKLIVSLALQALKRHWRFQDMAQFIQLELEKCDRDYGNWHVIVGTRFGGANTYQARRYIYFYIKQTGFLVFKF